MASVPEKPKLELSYSGLDAECTIRFISGLKTDAVRVAPREGDVQGFHFYGPSAASYARDILNVYLDKSNILPREPITTMKLINGCSEADITPLNRHLKIKMLNRQVEFLGFLKDGDLFSAVTLNDAIRDLEERKYLSSKWFENHDSTHMALVRVEKSRTEELKNEMETLEKEGKFFEEQRERFLKSLGEKPKAEVFIQKERHGDHRAYDEFKLYDVPKPVAGWLPQISNDKTSWNPPELLSKRLTLVQEAKENVEAIANFIHKNWQPTYSTPRLEESRTGCIKEAIEEFVTKGRKGILYGIGMSGHVDSSYPSYTIVKLDFDEERKQIQQRLEKEMEELKERKKQVLSD